MSSSASSSCSPSSVAARLRLETREWCLDLASCGVNGCVASTCASSSAGEPPVQPAKRLLTRPREEAFEEERERRLVPAERRLGRRAAEIAEIAERRPRLERPLEMLVPCLPSPATCAGRMLGGSSHV